MLGILSRNTKTSFIRADVRSNSCFEIPPTGSYEQYRVAHFRNPHCGLICGKTRFRLFLNSSGMRGVCGGAGLVGWAVAATGPKESGFADQEKE